LNYLKEKAPPRAALPKAARTGDEKLLSAMKDLNKQLDPEVRNSDPRSSYKATLGAFRAAYVAVQGQESGELGEACEKYLHQLARVFYSVPAGDLLHNLIAEIRTKHGHAGKDSHDLTRPLGVLGLLEETQKAVAA
jgi:hypothetical protein